VTERSVALKPTIPNRVGRHVRVPKTAELVAISLRRQIVRGEIGSGEALPSESALMEQFGVSRPTLREALRILESEALITVRRGVNGGARVSAPDPEVAARYAGLVLEYGGATVGDVYGAAAVIEPQCARSVAERHTEADIARLRAALAEEERVLENPSALVVAQDSFHRLLVELAGNKTITLLSGMLRHIIDRANIAHVATDGDTDAHRALARKGHRAHTKLVDLIAAGEAVAAEELWCRHLTATDDVINAMGGRTVLDLLG